MSMAWLYADENFPLPVVQALRELQYNVLTAFEAAQAGQAIPDEAVVAFATLHRRAVLTLNRKHFLKLHHDNSQHYGIIVCSLDVDFAGQAQRIHKAIAQYPDLREQLIRINRVG